MHRRRDSSTYARLSFNVGPGGQVLIPVEVDYSRDFGGSDHESWDVEYKANAQPTEWLTAMGIPWLQLVDFDVVETSNLASQGYLEEDLGKLKVEATAMLCRRINSGVEIFAVAERFRRSMDIGNAIFCCVGSIDVRRLIWQAVADQVSFFVDGRMNAETLRVLAACDGQLWQHYPTTLFRTEEAFVGPCTAKTTIYCANIAAGLMISQFTKYLRQLPVDPDVQLNRLASELSVAAACP